MRAGRLRHRVIIQEPTAGTPDAFNESTDTWSTFATVWAEVKPLNANENIRNEQVVMDATHIITIRHLSGITPDMRISFDSRTFNISSIINVFERNKEIQLVCKEEV